MHPLCSRLNRSFFKSLRNQYHNLNLASKKHFYSNLVSSSSGNPSHLWQTVNKLLHSKSSSSLPSSTPGISLADSFASFFTDKISNLRLSLSSNPLHHLHTHPLLLQHLLISSLLHLLLNLKS